MMDNEQLEQLLALLTIHRRNVGHLLHQSARYGGESFVPLPIMHELREVRKQIQEIKAILRSHGVSVEDVPGDEIISEPDHTTQGSVPQPILPPNSSPFNPGSPFQAPPLPPHFIRRNDDIRSLKARLEHTETSSAGILIITAIHGLGGIGKTTLAATIAHDSEVQKLFPDGVLWVTLGQQPDLLTLLNTWLQDLDRDFRSTSVDLISAHLRMLLKDKSTLLVIDDAWDLTHVRPFLVGGTHCRIIITTREALIPKAVRATIYDLGVLSPDQALNLMERKLERSISVIEQIQALDLAKVVGHLPLALELAAAQVAEGISWNDLLSDLKTEIARLEALSPAGVLELNEGERRYLSLRAAFALSLRRLSRNHLEQFAWLGVLAEDAQINPIVASVLWKTDPRTARETLLILRQKALLMSTKLTSTQDVLLYQLHDLIRDTARYILTASQIPKDADDIPGLGITLQDAHSYLIECYRRTARSDTWDTIPDDNYIYEHLTFHIEKSEQFDMIDSLLQQEMSRGHNRWYHVRERLGQTLGFISDVARAWRLTNRFKNSDDKYKLHRYVTLQCRYALITTSINSFARRLPPALLAALVQHGEWTFTQALAFARQSLERHQVEAIVALIPHLAKTDQPAIWNEALTAFQRIKIGWKRVAALAALLSLPEQDLHIDLQKTLTDAIATHNRQYCIIALRAIAPYLTVEMQRTILEVVLEPMPATECAKGLGVIAPHLHESLLGLALGIARKIKETDERALAMASLSTLVSDWRRAAITVVRSMTNMEYRSIVLYALAPHLPPLLLNEALEAAQTIEDDMWQAMALAALISKLPQPSLVKVRSLAQKLKSRDARVLLFTALSDAMPELCREALAIAQSIDDLPQQIETLAALAPDLSPQLRCTVLNLALQVVDEEHRASSIALLGPYLPESSLPEALVAIRAFRRPMHRVRALAGLAARLPEAQLQEALEASATIREAKYRTLAFNSLAPYLSEMLLNRSMLKAIAVKDTVVLSVLKPYLSESLLKDAFAIARGIRDKRYGKVLKETLAKETKLPPLIQWSQVTKAINQLTKRTQALREHSWERAPSTHIISSQVNPATNLLEKASVLSDISLLFTWQALFLASTTPLDIVRAVDLKMLAPHIPETWFDSVLKLIQTIATEKYRAKALITIAGYLPQSDLPNALRILNTLTKENERIEVLFAFASHIPDSSLPNLLYQFNELKNDEYKSTFLAFVITRWPRSDIGILLEHLRKINDEYQRLATLAALIPYLPKRWFSKALTIVWHFSDETYRAIGLVLLSPHLDNELLTEVLESAFEFKNLSLGIALVVSLTQLLNDPLLLRAFILGLSIDVDILRIKLLSLLSSHLTIHTWERALQAVRSMNDKWAQINVLVALVPHVPQTYLHSLWKEAWTIPEAHYRAKLMKALVPRMHKGLITENCELLNKSLHALAHRTRADLLVDLIMLAPLIYALGGTESIEETAHAIIDVGRWFP